MKEKSFIKLTPGLRRRLSVVFRMSSGKVAVVVVDAAAVVAVEVGGLLILRRLALPEEEAEGGWVVLTKLSLLLGLVAGFLSWCH